MKLRQIIWEVILYHIGRINQYLVYYVKNIRFSLIRIYLKEDMTLKVIDLHFMYIRNLYIIMIYTNL